MSGFQRFSRRIRESTVRATFLLPWITAALTCLPGAVASANDLPRARAEDVGLSSARLEQMDRFYANRVRKGEMAGIVILVARHGKVAHLSATGYANVASRQPIKTDTLFRLYSMTKPITATALMMLYEEGRFQLTDPISKYIPEFAHLRVLRAPDSALDDTVPVEHPPTIEDLLRHTAGFTQCLGDDPVDRKCTQENIYGLDVSLAQEMTRLARIPLRYQPGREWIYSLAPDVEARIVEVLSQMPFEEFLAQRLFKPLAMSNTHFWLTKEQYQRLSAVHWSKDGVIEPWGDGHGHPLDAGHQAGASASEEEPWASINKEGTAHARIRGSYGLISTAEDYWRFAQMIDNGGELDGIRLLSPATVRYMTRDHLGSIDSTMLADIQPGAGFGLGFGVIKDPVAARFLSAEGSVWWDGAASTFWWVDREEDLVVVAMTQYLDPQGINSQQLRPQLRAWIYGALLN